MRIIPDRSRSVSVAVRDLRVTFGRHVALDDVSLELRRGTSTALIGANGSGKTTLLHTLAGLVDPTRGSVRITDEARPIAYLLQRRDERHWLPLTVREVLRMGRFRDRGMLARMRATDRETIATCAQRLEVDGLLDVQYDNLSGGQRQRVLMAQALIQQPRLLLLDEPITGLDIASQRRILEVVESETARGTTVVLSTHHLEEARSCDRAVLLARRVVADGAPNEVLSAENLERAFAGRIVAPQDGKPGEVVLVDDHGHDEPHEPHL